MKRSTKEIISDISKVLSEATERKLTPIFEVGDFVECEGDEWIVREIKGSTCMLENPEGKKCKKDQSEIILSDKKLTEEDFADMPMAGPLDAFDDEIEAIPIDQLKDMPAQDKGVLGLDMDAITGDDGAEIDPDLYDASIERDPYSAGGYKDDEAQDAGYPSPAFAGGMRETKKG